MRNMGKYFVLSVLLFFLMSGGCREAQKTNSESLKPVFNDPVIERVDNVYNSGPALTPSIVKTAQNTLIVTWNTRGDGMPDTKTMFAASNDLGKTWSQPYLEMTSDNPNAGLGASLYKIENKNKIMCGKLELVWPTADVSQAKPDFHKLAAQRKFDYYYCFLEDNARTFGKWKRLNDPQKRNDFPQGDIVKLPNGDLLWPWGWWGSNPLNGFRRSTDNGLTWEPVERAWQDPPEDYEKPLGFNETALTVCKDGSLTAIARVDSLKGKHFWQIRSYDNGYTWTKPKKISIRGGSPALYTTKEGQLWLAYRDGGLGPGLGLAASDDNGQSWRFLYHLKEPDDKHNRYSHLRYTEEDLKKQWRPSEGTVGYPWFCEISDNEVYVVFHAHDPALANVYENSDFPFYIVGNLLEIPD